MDIRELQNLSDIQLEQLISEAKKEQKVRRKDMADQYSDKLAKLIKEILDHGFNIDCCDGCESAVSLSPCDKEWWVKISP